MTNVDFDTPRHMRRDDVTWHGPHVGTVNYRSGKIAIFHHQPVHNPSKSAQAGSPQYDDKIFVKIVEPGNNLEIVDREASDVDKQNWPGQWAAFCRSAEQVPDGTPLDVLFPTSPATCQMLRAQNVYTVEQLAGLSAHAVNNIMGGQMHVNKARAYLDSASRGVELHRFEAELRDRDSQIRTLQRQVQNLQQAMTEMTGEAQDGQAPGLQARRSGRQLRPTFPQPQRIEPAFDGQAAQIAALDAQRRGPAPRPRRSRVPE